MASLVAQHGLWDTQTSVVAYELSCPGGMWNLPRPGIEPMSYALAGRFLTTGPPESLQL